MWQVVGHDHAVRLLQNSIDAGRVSHAYLFSGPRHVGKSTLAREFAKALNCEGTDRPCGRCRSCKKIDASVHPDVQFIGLEEGAKNISIDSVRSLQESVALKPFEGRTKVYVIQEAERLSEAAANSLLKTLEEPPSSVVLVLTTQDATSLLPTVVSRCQEIDLRPVAALLIEATLRDRGVDPQQAKLLAALAKGRLGWAVGTASSKGALTRRFDLVERLAGLPRASRVDRFAYAAEIAILYGRDPESARTVLETWQSWWRDLLLYRLGLPHMAINADLSDRLSAEAGAYSIEALGAMIAAIQQTITLLGQNVNQRLALEALMLKVPKPVNSHQSPVVRP